LGTTFVTLTLGRSANAIDLFVPTAPAVHAAADLKARCFDFLADLLLEHSLLYSSAELIAVFGHIPGSSYNATMESAAICSTICSDFFSLPNLVGLGFRTHLGTLTNAAITPNISTQPPGILYFAFQFTVNPASLDPQIVLPSHTFEFWLALPQTATTSTTTTDHACHNIAATFDTPDPSDHSSAPSPLHTIADLEGLDPLAFAALGAANDVRHFTLQSAQEKIVTHTIARKLKQQTTSLSAPFSATPAPPLPSAPPV
jgi:hypothetical protein